MLGKADVLCETSRVTPPTSSSVAFIGLGVMGRPMARHLANAEHEVVVYNRTASRAEEWVRDNGHRSAATPAEAASGANFVMVCVGNDDDVRSVVYGSDGALTAMKPGSTLIDHTTASADLARELALACREQGVGFIDAPVSGGQIGAENGALSIMCGCDDDMVFQAALPVLDSYAKVCERLGPAGSGQLAKMVNQICIAGVVQGVAEGINFAVRAGLDVEQLVRVIGQGAAGSWQLNSRSATMAREEFDFGFAVEWMRKDLGIAQAEGERLGARLPVTGLIDQFYAQIVARGGRRWDTSSLITLLQHP